MNTLGFLGPCKVAPVVVAMQMYADAHKDEFGRRSHDACRRPTWVNTNQFLQTSRTVTFIVQKRVMARRTSSCDFRATGKEV